MKRFVAVALGLLASSPAWAYWRVNVVETSDGEYRALSEHVVDGTHGTVDRTEDAGTYSTRKEARKAAKELTEANNAEDGFMPGDPECDLPNVYC